jgi:hypothetical protein
MEYMTKDELGRLLRVAKCENQLHWQMILTGFYFGLRVSEVTAILGEDVQDNRTKRTASSGEHSEIVKF